MHWLDDGIWSDTCCRLQWDFIVCVQIFVAARPSLFTGVEWVVPAVRKSKVACFHKSEKYDSCTIRGGITFRIDQV